MTNCSREKVNNLRHAEYYDMQSVFDELYDKAKRNESFDDLMNIILSKENILLAYRNIKTNTGSHTQGTDRLTIDDIGRLSSEKVVDKVRSIINGKQGYRPKPVRRKEIPKPNGSMRPLGIPCIWDRLVQQCIKQVMEPICEAHFCDHSYGFRPGRSVEHAMAEVNKHLNQSKCRFIVEFDIKGFFDNVNHSKLIKQIWALGIHDKQLLYVIKKILKAPIKMPDKSLIYPDKGTPQGGIISPLLANIVLNELDWWVTSQWENNPVVSNYSVQINENGSQNKGSGYRAMRKTKLKEMHIVRYADDFRILCKTRSDAEKIKLAVTMWLKERLKLDISPEKTRVINAKRKYSEFLGFKVKVKEKSGKYVTEAHICDKKIKSITKELKEQVKKIARPKDDKEALAETLRYNSKVLGIQNYFQIASHVNIDLSEIGYKVNRTMTNRLGSDKHGRLSRTGRNLTKFEKDKYGKSKMLRFDSITGSPIYPINYVKARNPMYMRHGQTPYTAEGRKLMHDNLGINIRLMHELMLSPTSGTVEYADNRISLYSAQWGKCAVTGKPFENTSEMHCHHKKPRHLGGSDKYDNLVLVHEQVHKLIHATKNDTASSYLKVLNLTKDKLNKVNNLRKLAELDPIIL